MSKNFNCEICKALEREIEEIAGNIDKSDIVISLSNFFKVLGDKNRMKILLMILYNEMCVCDMLEKLGMEQSAVSHQLKILKNARLVKIRRDRNHLFYSLNDNHIEMIFKMGIEHILEEGCDTNEKESI